MAQYRSVKARKLRHVMRSIADRHDLNYDMSGKHDKISKSEHDYLMLPVNHPRKDVPNGFIKEAIKKIEEWGIDKNELIKKL